MMPLSFKTAMSTDLEKLISIRIGAMRESLENVGRFDPERARERFANKFTADKTTLVLQGDEIIGFYVLLARENYLWLDHLYIDPATQGVGVGSSVMNRIIKIALSKKLPLKLCALKESKANIFYIKHGFELTHSEEWDNFYSRPYL
ncbi:GNAT family N-acetyltransferase [Kiloniella sp.]|uniref:GNAT family N-acetyltransferase n=1 Tax=Kiloniella sp. TaxID=1938587 RepID=UPI003A948FF7